MPLRTSAYSQSSLYRYFRVFTGACSSSCGPGRSCLWAPCLPNRLRLALQHLLKSKPKLRNEMNDAFWPSYLILILYKYSVHTMESGSRTPGYSSILAPQRLLSKGMDASSSFWMLGRAALRQAMSSSPYVRSPCRVHIRPQDWLNCCCWH